MDYHDIKLDTQFKETSTKPNGRSRTVKVTRLMTYAVDCLVVEGRGAGTQVRVWRKQLIDSKLWTAVP